MFAPTMSKRQGFFEVPGYPQYAVSEVGEVIDLELDQPVKTNAYTYLVVQGGEYIPVHSLVTRAFHGPPPSSVVRYTANHKNGIKYDNSKDNLEWTTVRENNLHALKAGLRTDAIPVLVKDIKQNFVQRFYGQNEAARFIGVTQSRVSQILNGDQQVVNRRFIIIREGDDWPNIDELRKEQLRAGIPRALVLENVETGKVLVFGSVPDTAQLMNWDVGALRKALHDRDKDVVNKATPYKGYIITNCTDEEKLEDLHQEQKNKKIQTNHRHRQEPMPIQVTDLNTGDKTIWSGGTREFALSNGALPNTVRSMMSRNGDHTGGRWRNYDIRYLKMYEKKYRS